MKRILFTFYSAVFILSGFSQGKVIFRDLDKNALPDTVKFIQDISDAGLQSAYEIEGFISNVSNESVQIKIHRVVEKYIANTNDQICWANQCVQYTYRKLDQWTENAQQLSSGEDFPLIDNTNVVFHFLHNSQVGTTQIKYYLMNGSIVEDSLVAVYTLTGPKVTLTFNVSMANLDGFIPTSKVYVEGDFGDKIQMVSWDSSTYWVSVPVDLNKSYTYKYIAGSNTETVEHSVNVASKDISTSDEFNVTSSVISRKVSSQMSAPMPNPAYNYTQVKLSLKENTSGFVVLRNILGQKIFEQNLSQKNCVINIPLDQLPAGIYFVNLEIKKNTISSYKIIKQ